MVRVLIVEHFATTAAVIRTLLADSTRVAIVGEAADASGALSLLERLRPDVVVLDGALGHRDGHSLIRQMKEAQPAVRLIVLSDHPAPLSRDAAAASGADRLILKVDLAMLKVGDERASSLRVARGGLPGIWHRDVTIPCIPS